MLEAITMVLLDQERSDDIAARKMLKVNPFVLAWMKRLKNAATTMYQP